ILLRAPLQIEVERKVDIAARYRILSRIANFGEPASMTVVLPELRSFLAAQIFVVHQLDAALADQISLLEVFVLQQFLLGDFSEESDDMGGHCSVRIVPALHGADV